MASIEFLTKRVEGKEKEVPKLEKKIERILKAKESGWEENPYYYNERDLKWAQRDLENARKGFVDYREKLDKEKEKAASRNVQVIIDFLEQWKIRMEKYYRDVFPRYVAATKEFDERSSEHTKWWNYERKSLSKEEWGRVEKEYRVYKREYAAKWGFMEEYATRNYLSGDRELHLDEQLLREDLKREAECKYDDIIERTNDIVGKITDASGLHIGAKGDLNGFIVGDKGTAKVATIGAGGYNVQCFHFRTLIREV